MALITGDPTDIAFQVRLTIGDTSGELFEDSTILYYLSVNNQDVYKTSVQLLQFGVNFLSGKYDHAVGEVRVDISQLLAQKKQLLSDLLTDPSRIKGTLGLIVTGISVAQTKAYREDTDWLGSPIHVGQYLEDD